MTKKKTDVPFQGHDGTGLDADFKKDRAELNAAIEKDMTGPKSDDIQVAANDTDMKNPDNEFSDPGSAALIEHLGSQRKCRRDIDMEGRQGTSRRGARQTRR
jgi:hypothetical protein